MRVTLGNQLAELDRTIKIMRARNETDVARHRIRKSEAVFAMANLEAARDTLAWLITKDQEGEGFAAKHEQPLSAQETKPIVE